MGDSTLGASAQDWLHFDLVLGLGADMLPVVPDPHAIPSEHSAVAKFGKIPSIYDRNGRAVGLAKWTTRTTEPIDIERWSRDPRLGFCIRTSAVRAIDVDVTDLALATQLREVLAGTAMPVRMRANSPKFLMAFRLPGQFRKRIITTPHGRIEFLADGQQFVAAGCHPSGARYTWEGGLPESFPELTEAQFETLWETLSAFGAPAPIRRGVDASVDYAQSEQLTTISESELVNLREALGYAPLRESALDNSVWSEVGYALITLGGVGSGLWKSFSESAAGYEPGAPETWWAAHEDQETRTDFRHIFTMAKRLGWHARASLNDFSIAPPSNYSAPTPPILQLIPGKLHAYAEQAENILRDEIYVRGSSLVRVGVSGERPELSTLRAADQKVIMEVTQEFLRRRLTDCAVIQSFSKTKGDWVPCDCPPALARNIAQQGSWPNLRTLHGIARGPFFRADGSVCSTEGYDDKSAVMYLPNAVFPPIPEAPSRTDALQALNELIAPFAEFVFATPVMRAVFMAHLLTEASRPAYATAPIFFYTAPTAGTGKTLLSEIPPLIVHGGEPAMKPWSASEEELRKAIFASLLAADPSVRFDNVPSGIKVRSAILCTILTAGHYSDRELGVSRSPKIPNRTTFAASGNNITPVADLARRSLVIRLDSNLQSAQMKQRAFQIPNLRKYIADNRPRLLVAALTIIRAYLQSDAAGPTPMPSFEDWSRFVRNPLLWLGMADPVDSQVDETDDETAPLARAFELIASSSINKEPFTAAELAVDQMFLADTEITGNRNEALELSGCSNPADKLKVGYWLRDKRDMVAGGFKLMRIGTHPPRWKVQRLQTASPNHSHDSSNEFADLIGDIRIAS